MFQNFTSDFFIDITDDVCPMTFVKTKLLIEKMKSGQIIEIRLCGREPLDNVPRNLKEHGHELLCLERERGSLMPYGVHRLVVKKN
ncbi:MAG: SirA protein [Magnetovibrio sp.]|nr:SirA protein [Magnetovibrio sp.]|tara:strand:+ start:213 stop:470 length:258 start_codon:yes stop_codon:yes gene_type:complete